MSFLSGNLLIAYCVLSFLIVQAMRFYVFSVPKSGILETISEELQKKWYSLLSLLKIAFLSTILLGLVLLNFERPILVTYVLVFFLMEIPIIVFKFLNYDKKSKILDNLEQEIFNVLDTLSAVLIILIFTLLIISLALN